MNGEAIIGISAAVVGLMQLLKTAPWIKRYALILIFLVSALAVGLWGWSEEALVRATAFQFFAGWIAVSTSAAGVFGLVRSAPEQLAEFRKPKV